MEHPESIMQTLRGAVKSGDGSVIEAKVIAVSPLKVQAANDDKLILPAASLVVPRHLTDYAAAAAFAADSGSRTQGTITICNALKVGETVYLLRYNDGKKYYILDRKEA